MIPTRTSSRTVALVSLLGGAMVTATYLQGALSVLSSFIIDDLGISRSQLGVAFAAFSVMGGLSSPAWGYLTDRNARRVMAALFVSGAAGMVATAAAPSFGSLLGASALGGLGLGAGNPITNRVISQRIRPARRGLVIGMKQAGPPLGLLAAGVALPAIAVAHGWRTAMAASVVLPLVGLASTPALIPSEGGDGGTAPASSGTEDARSVVIWLTVIGFGVAMGLSSVLAFLPLFAQEDVGLTATAAGAVAAFAGLAGVVGRIMWGHHGSRFRRPSSALLAMSAISLVAIAAIALASASGPLLLWIGAAGIGGSMLAWHSVAWLVIIDRVGSATVGKASGVMQLGNSFGFAAGPPISGWVIDVTGSYGVGWGVVGALFTIVTALTLWVRIHGTGRSRRGSGSRG